jgi:hypothetical protein
MKNTDNIHSDDLAQYAPEFSERNAANIAAHVNSATLVEPRRSRREKHSRPVRHMRRGVMLAAVITAFAVLTGAAFAAAGKLDLGSFYNSFFDNPEVTTAQVSGKTTVSSGIEVTLESAYSDGDVFHAAFTLRDTVGDRLRENYRNIMFSFNADDLPVFPRSDFSGFGHGANTVILNEDGSLTVVISDSLGLLGPAEYVAARETGHITLRINAIGFSVSGIGISDTDPVVAIDLWLDADTIYGEWDISFDFVAPGADATASWTAVAQSDYLGDVTFTVTGAQTVIRWLARNAVPYNPPEDELAAYDAAIAEFESELAANPDYAPFGTSERTNAITGVTVSAAIYPQFGYQERWNAEVHKWITAMSELYSSAPAPYLTLKDGTVIALVNGYHGTFDNVGSEFDFYSAHFDIAQLESITFCGETFLVG